jgi:hypothetical protein|tara:strand:- start:1295 stop:1408 length:114 start_codon:yes stop_codon:yes gene_type:complete
VTKKFVDDLAALFAIFFSIYLACVLAWHLNIYFFSAG